MSKLQKAFDAAYKRFSKGFAENAPTYEEAWELALQAHTEQQLATDPIDREEWRGYRKALNEYIDALRA